MTELEIPIPFSGIDPRGRLKLNVLLEMFQEMADVDASKYNLSVRQTLEDNVTWVLRKYRIDIKSYPTKESAAIKIKTFAEPYKRLFSLRTFQFWDSKDNFLGSASTWWVLIDFIKQRPIRLDKSDYMSAFNEQISDELPKDVKVPPLTNPQLSEIWKTRWQDLDVNNHVNHAVYFSWVLDTVPEDIPEKMSPIYLEAEFLRPIPRTRVLCLTEKRDSELGLSFLHSLRHIDDESEYAKFLSIWQ